jgi:hypothetical protein
MSSRHQSRNSNLKTNELKTWLRERISLACLAPVYEDLTYAKGGLSESPASLPNSISGGEALADSC